MLGYVAARHQSIDIARLGAEGSDHVNGVNVVWTATRPPPNKGRIVVGWYKNATVFRKPQKHRDREWYHCRADETNCYRVELDDRTFEIESKGEGRPSRPVWYGKSPYGQRLRPRIEQLLAQEFDFEELERKRRSVGKMSDRPKGVAKPLKKKQEVVVYGRDPYIRAFTLRRANGKCELCRRPAPFKDAHGDPFLEVHHVERLAEGGADKVENAVALCPNCHREAHFGTDPKAVQGRLKALVKRQSS